MEFHLYKCRHCGFEAYYLESMLRHQAEHYQKPVTANTEVDRTSGSGRTQSSANGG